MTRKSTDQFENDIDRLEQRGNLVLSSMEGASGVKEGNRHEAVRYFEHVIMYLRASIK